MKLYGQFETVNYADYKVGKWYADINEYNLSVTTSIGFQGYKGGFEDKGKGTSKGDGKDKAMREVANVFVGELESKRLSSSLTSATEIAKKANTEPQISEKVFIDGKGIGLHDVASAPANLKSGQVVVMLARNGKLSSQPLSPLTKNRIKNLKEKFDAEFVVGDMPGVDSQFIDYLQEIGAKFTIYHTGSTSRINVTAPTVSTEITFETLTEFTPERKKEILSNFGAKHKMTEAQTLSYLNEALKTKDSQKVISKLKECY